MANVTIHLTTPEGVTKAELEEFLKYKLLGHSSKTSLIEKFNDELDVDDFTIRSM